jgi:hypothetical protein
MAETLAGAEMVCREWIEFAGCNGRFAIAHAPPPVGR